MWIQNCLRETFPSLCELSSQTHSHTITVGIPTEAEEHHRKKGDEVSAVLAHLSAATTESLSER